MAGCFWLLLAGRGRLQGGCLHFQCTCRACMAFLPVRPVPPTSVPSHNLAHLRCLCGWRRPCCCWTQWPPQCPGGRSPPAHPLQAAHPLLAARPLLAVRPLLEAHPLPPALPLQAAHRQAQGPAPPLHLRPALRTAVRPAVRARRLRSPRVARQRRRACRGRCSGSGRAGSNGGGGDGDDELSDDAHGRRS